MYASLPLSIRQTAQTRLGFEHSPIQGVSHTKVIDPSQLMRRRKLPCCREKCIGLSRFIASPLREGGYPPGRSAVNLHQKQGT
jgi:hypothetical protein